LLPIAESDEPDDEDFIENIDFLDDAIVDALDLLHKDSNYENNIEGIIVVADD
jgi:hypothetical protein